MTLLSCVEASLLVYFHSLSDHTHGYIMTPGRGSAGWQSVCLQDVPERAEGTCGTARGAASSSPGEADARPGPAAWALNLFPYGAGILQRWRVAGTESSKVL